MKAWKMEKSWNWRWSWDNGVQSRARGNTEAKIGRDMLIMDYKGLVNAPAGDSVHVLHHCARAVQSSEIVTEELLCPATNKRLRARIIKNGLG